MGNYSKTLCIDCKNVRKVENNRGSLFLMCEKHQENPRYPQYPPQPVFSCKGYEKEVLERNEGEDWVEEDPYP